MRLPLPDGTSQVITEYIPRKQFEPFHARKQRFAALVCHRRAGKTVASVNDLQDGAVRCKHERPRFAYIAPFLKQAKGVAWDHLRAAASSFGPDGHTVNEAELRIDYHTNGSRLQLYGADNPDAIRGLGFDGVVLDEYADFDPRVWPEIVRPTLSSRKGWAAFIGTPRGHNAFYELVRDARTDPEQWFSLTLKASESGILTQEELASIKLTQTEDQYEQEYECSFEAAIHGAYYAKEMTRAREDGRIMGVPYDPSALVWTAWDLGISDATAIWFAQVIGREIHLIDYYEARGMGLGHYVSVLRDKPYVYESHLLPHDSEARELGTGKTRRETLEGLGLTQCRTVTQHRKEDGVNAVRMLLPKCYFDDRKCARAVEALTLFRADVDKRYIDPVTKQPLLKGEEVRDWTTHCADAFRYLAMGIDDRGVSAAFNKKIIYPNLGLA